LIPSNQKELSPCQSKPRDVQRRITALLLLSSQVKDPNEPVGCRFAYCWQRSL